MANKKNAPPAKQPPKKIKSTNGCFIITLLLILLVTVSLGATFYFLFLRPGPTAIPAPGKLAPPPMAQPLKTVGALTPETSAPPEPATTLPAEPTLEPEPEPAISAPVEPPPSTQTTGPKLAIIIDDIGNTKAIAEQIIAIDLPLNFSILPHTPHANHLASMAKARGHNILLHLPMEASDPRWSAGPGTLLLAMSKAEILSTLDQDLETPYRVIGINNHMGSKFSEDPVAMRTLLNAIKAKSLFFIDSLTAINSVGYTLAQDMGIKSAKRDVFLDNEQEPTKILAQIGKAIALAHKHGSAIAIGHPYPATLEALRAADNRLRQEVTVVPVQELVQ